MTYETIFSIINIGVLPAWLMLVFLPSSQLTKSVVHSFLYPVVYGLIYTGLIVNSLFFGASAEGAGFSSIGGVMALFDHPNGTLAGWSHYLVFDLFVGTWISRDALDRGIKHLFIVPCLFFTFMFGPIGLLIYVAIRGLHTRSANQANLS
ncbi:ABA4-like family protein [Kordiimonas sp. SCSIO 12610]|uniref:ABA4-like family protein n=1 Tax=Kordiimonas sp. SCSIO 12610 TaxID=2829597 RepID=UPI0021093D3E|nr:ABA4-like family protein [Kordiimonas sp. SCSIO 12610]UTW55852.1 DUF4281 domain-containing protein [Kordiimonas sp. SCSIO 12610]